MKKKKLIIIVRLNKKGMVFDDYTILTILIYVNAGIALFFLVATIVALVGIMLSEFKISQGEVSVKQFFKDIIEAGMFIGKIVIANIFLPSTLCLVLWLIREFNSYGIAWSFLSIIVCIIFFAIIIAFFLEIHIFDNMEMCTATSFVPNCIRVVVLSVIAIGIIALRKFLLA